MPTNSPCDYYFAIAIASAFIAIFIGVAGWHIVRNRKGSFDRGLRGGMPGTSSKQLHKMLIYLDREFIADLYEVTLGVSPNSTITKNEGKKASASVRIFSAEVSAQETRSYKVSTFEMLLQTFDTLAADDSIAPKNFTTGMMSQYGWLEGELSVFQAKSKTQRSNGPDEVLAESEHFHIRQSGTVALSLITTPEYFSSGLATLVKLQKTALEEMSIPVRAYVRVVAAHDHFKQWIAIPLVILERTPNASLQ